MARVTVEDCVEKVEDRFELVALAARRAKSIASGAPLNIERNGEKNTVLALREIGDGLVDVQDLREELVLQYQTQRDMDADVHTDDAEGLDDSEAATAQKLESEGSVEEYEEEVEVEAAVEAAAEEGMSFAEDNLDNVQD